MVGREYWRGGFGKGVWGGGVLERGSVGREWGGVGRV